VESGKLCRPPAPLTGNQFKQPTNWTDKERLNDASINYGLCQLFQLGLVECRSRLLLAGSN
jgi:hypothetical protein